MARQNNLLQLSGTIGKVVNYERNGDYFTRTKPDEVKQTEKTQKASVEFGRASAAASRLVKGFYPLLKLTPHTGTAYNRLTSAFTKIVNSGHVDPLFRDVDPSAKQAISVRAL